MTKVEIRKISTTEEDSYIYEVYAAYVDGQEVGSASVMTDEKSTYVDRIDIDEAHRNHGYGTAFLMALRGIYGGLVLAPDNEDARRLYDRLGTDVSRDYWMVDQGYGVYEI
jgi:GNAT superfamily N-acetyltransferase